MNINTVSGNQLNTDLYNMSKCTMCPRNCGANRTTDTSARNDNNTINSHSSTSHISINNYGFCGQSDTVTLARAALHMWEEPCISGTHGSGAIFFCGCNLRCVFCQNADLANSKIGKPVSINRLADIFLELQDAGAHNINLITAGHFIPQVATALEIAKKHDLSIPIVYNTGTYEYPGSIQLLEGLIDIYMPDLKYMDSVLSKSLSHAPDYYERATAAIEEMFRQVGAPEFTDNIMKKGVLVRHLVLPGHTKDSCNILDYLYNTYADNIYISIMNQYTPMTGNTNQSFTDALSSMPELGRTLTSREYEKVVNHALSLGITNAFIQEGTTCTDSFIPTWDYTGI